MSNRVNPKYRETGEPAPKVETVLSLKPGSVDDMLNAPTQGNAASTQHPRIPRVDDPSVMKPIEGWLAEAIASGEELHVTDDPALVGTRTEQKHEIVPALDGNDVPPPIKQAMDDLNATRLEKRELLAKAKFSQDSLHKEREFYSQQRPRRAIQVPDVPSGKIMYPENAAISYTPYNVQDIEDINNPDVPLYDKYRIMLEGIYTLGMTPLELTFSDFTFVGDARHLQALGDSYFEYPYVCKTCGKPGLHTFHLSDVGFATMPATSIPLHVRFHTFPDEVFLFAPHTIGDVMHLLKTDKYWRSMGEEYLSSKPGDRRIDTIAVNACRCISHPWEDAYFKLLQASENPDDRAIMREIGKALYHGSEPLKFSCRIPIDKRKQKEMEQTTAKVVNGIMSGEYSVDTPNNPHEMPPWMQAHIDGPAANPVEGQPKTGLKMCGAENTIDVVAGDIIIPFRRRPINMEYGILTMQVP